MTDNEAGLAQGKSDKQEEAMVRIRVYLINVTVCNTYILCIIRLMLKRRGGHDVVTPKSFLLSPKSDKSSQNMIICKHTFCQFC